MGKVVMFVVLAAFVGLIFFQWGADITSRAFGGSKVPKGVVGRVDKEDIKLTEYQNALRQALAAQEQSQRKTQLTDDQVDSLHQAVWQDLVLDKIWGSFFKHEGTTISDAEVFEILKSNPPAELRDREELKTDGKFDMQKYMSLLQEPRLQPYFDAYAQELKKAMPREKVRWDILGSYRVTSSEAHDFLSREGAAVTATFLLLGPKFGSQLPKPTDAELKVYYEANKKVFEKPEEKYLKFVAFPNVPSSADSVSARERIDDADAAIKKGENFTDIAKDYSDEPVESTRVSIAKWPEREKAILSSLKPGEISEPFIDVSGWHIVRSLEKKGDSLRIEPISVHIRASGETIESLKEQIDKFRTQASKARGKFDTIAKNFGLAPRDMPPAREGKVYFPGLSDPTAIETFVQHARIGSVSQAIKTPNAYLVFCLTKIDPKGIRPFDKVKEALTTRWTRDKQQELLKNGAQDIYQKARSGMSLEQIAKVDSRIVIDSAEYKSFSECRGSKGSRFAGALYALRSKETSGPVETEWGYFVVRCDTRKEGEWTGDLQAWEKEYQQGIIKMLSETFFPTPKIEDYRDAFFY
jgi:parvulin-like peptidyl-prolyl isomerase